MKYLMTVLLLLPFILCGQTYTPSGFGGFSGMQVQDDNNDVLKKLEERYKLVPTKNNPYASIDSYAVTLDFYEPEVLATMLTCPFESDSEKVRALFFWITQNIAYDVDKYHNLQPIYIPLGVTKENINDYAQHRYAEMTCETGKGVCEDYASLFKVMCDKVKIKCVVIHGAAKTKPGQTNTEFKTNHAWNAVEVNGKWRLVDACWASGYSNDDVTMFIKKYKEKYYFTDPELFVKDHYPEDSTWLLLDHPISKNTYIKTQNDSDE